MEHRKASDFPRGLLDLFHEYQHGHVDVATLQQGLGVAGAALAGGVNIVAGTGTVRHPRS
jgi:hypothetical protein